MLLCRRAVEADLPTIIALLGDDDIARQREGFEAELTEQTRAAFKEIEADPNNELWVGELDGQLIATLQLTIIPGLARRGALRGQVEAVRVRGDHRGSGLGAELMRWAIAESRRRGCALVQLTSGGGH